MTRASLSKRLRALETGALLSPEPAEWSPMELARRICWIFHQARRILDAGEPEPDSDDCLCVDIAARIHEILYPEEVTAHAIPSP